MAHTYKFQKINEIQKEIIAEWEKHTMLSERYHRAVKVFYGVDNALVVASKVLSVTGIGILSMIVSAPVAIAMEGIALGTGLLVIIGSQVNKELSLKVEKHEKTTLPRPRD